MKKTKRNIILSLILAAAIILPTLGMFAWAEFNGSLSIDAPSSAVPGETVRVIVSIPKNTDAINGSFNLNYDHTMLEVVSCTAGTVIKDYNVNISEAYATDKIRLTFQGDEPLSGGGTALTVVFRVLPSASGIAHFECEKFKLFDADYNAISTTDSASADTYIVNDAETVISIEAPESAQSGDTVEVLVKVEDPQNLYGGSFNLVYDPMAFTVKNAAGGSLLSSFTKQINKNYAENKVRFIWAGSSAVSGNGTLAKVTFTVNDGVQGACDFALERIKNADANGTVLECAAENAQTNLTCTHAHMAWTVTTPATCTEAGVETYQCGCGEAEGTREIPATGHQTFDWITVTESTCTESGMEEYACLKCGYVQETREIAATGHTHMEWVTTVNETCDNEGVKEYKCADCGYVETTETVAAHGHLYEDVVTPPTKTEDGYTTHACRYCGVNYTDSIVPALGFDVTYNANGGEGAPSLQNKKAGEAVTLSGTIPTREGYAFLGWATGRDATEAEYYGGNEYTEDADIMLYAVWEANKHTVTYLVDGAVYTIKTYDYNTLIDAEPEPQREGHTFSGWSDIPIHMPNEDVEVTGSFSVNSYTVTFDANGGENPPAEIEATYGTEITLPSVQPTRENANFVGWGKAANAHKADYVPGGKLTLTSNITLYAVWTEIWDGTADDITLSGRGTRANPYRISNASELAFMAERVNAGDEAYNAAYYIQTADIALNDVSNVENWDTQPPANEWVPIGNTNYFMGMYDGNGYTISGLYINKTTQTETLEDCRQGLFGFIDGATITNVGIKSGYIRAYRYSGALVGGAYGGTIKNCYNKATVVGDINVAGVVGAVNTKNSEFIIDNCYNAGDITVGNYSGGILGGITPENDIEIKNCYNTGSVSGESCIGGIVGTTGEAQGNITIYNCSNEGSIVSQKNHIGGIAGYFASTPQESNIISSCKNNGTITGVARVGGIVGTASKTIIKYCYNANTITYFDGTYDSSSDYGGICGAATTSSMIHNCYNVGTVDAKLGVGGIVSLLQEESAIYNCLNAGNVAGDSIVGGICGGYAINGQPIVASINLGTVAGNVHTGAIVGPSYATAITNCYYLSTCSAAGLGKALTYAQMQAASNYSYYATSNESWDAHWLMGSNPYAVYPMLRGMDDLIENPLELDLNGGELDEYELCASVFASVVNKESGTDYLAVYNNSGTKTGTADYGCEVLVDSRNVVTDIIEYQGNNVVSTGGFILYGNHIMHEWILKNIEVGDKVYFDTADEKVKVYKKNPKFTYATGFSTYLPTPHKDGYIFKGWYNEDENLITYNTKINKTGLLQLHAKWDEPTELTRTAYSGNTYIVFDAGTAWESAKRYCESIGGHLATVTSAEENAALASAVSSYNISFMIGGTDSETEGTFKWITGEPLSYSNWNSGEPNDGDPSEDIIVLRSDGKWNDHKTDYLSTVGFICEIENPTPVNATIYNGHYYQAFDQTFTWEQAKTVCENMGGHLATVTSSGENDAMKALVENQANKLYWLGGTDETEEGAWHWITGEEWDYSHWNTNQPDNSGGQEHCLQMFTKKENEATNGFWNDSRNAVISTYSTSIGFVCEYDSITPTETVEYNGHRYELYDSGLSWNHAKEYCDSAGGYLATITSAGENAALLGMVRGKSGDYSIGATDVGSEGNWRWITGETWDYTNWTTGEPNNYGDAEHYGSLHPSGEWNDLPEKFYYNNGFICEYGNTEEYTSVGTFMHDGHYYEIYDNVLSWQYAKSYCETKGGHLATITSSEENLAVMNAISQFGNLDVVEKYWLGGNDVVEEGNFQWITGEEWDYTNWNTGEPNNDGNEDYAVIFSRTSTLGKWNDSPSQRSMTGFIYEYELKECRVFCDGEETATQYEGEAFVLPVPEEREEMIFLGWATTQNATEAEYQAGEPVTITADTEFYSVWQPWHALTYRMNAAKGEWTSEQLLPTDTAEVETQTQYRYRDKETTTRTDTNAIEGWTLYRTDRQLGTWINNGAEPVQPVDTVALKREVQIKYVNGEAQYSYRDTTYTYHFYRWSDWSAWQETAVTQSDEQDVENRTMYRYVDKEDAIFAVNTTKDTLTIIQEQPSREGYFFLGWSEDANAVAGQYKYRAGATVSLAQDTDLYAVWVAYPSGTCGENATWSISGDGTLTISGTGAMDDYITLYSRPWTNVAQYIHRVVVEDGITSIGESAFQDLSNITEVQLPESVQSIGIAAFRGCKELEEIVLPSGLTEISDYLFANCFELKEIILPTGIVAIGGEAFMGTAITEIVIPDGVKTIGVQAFRGTKLIEATLPTGLTQMSFRIFDSCKDLTSMTIPDGLEIIDGEAFYGCENLRYVSLPSSITSIGQNAFADCKNLAEVAYGGTEENWSAILISSGNDDLIYARTGEEIPEGKYYYVVYHFENGEPDFRDRMDIYHWVRVTDIIPARDGYTFMGWASAPDIAVPEYHAGYGVYLSQDVHLYAVWSGATTEEPIEPTDAPELMGYTVTYQVNVDGAHRVVGEETGESITVINTVPEGEKYHTFLGWSTDETATVPQYSAGDTIELSENLTLYAVWANGVIETTDGGLVWSIKDGVLTVLSGKILDYTPSDPAPWNDCASDITKIVISDGITAVGDYAFYKFANATEVELAESITTIGNYAFSNCTALETINAFGVTTVGDYAFRYCTSLESVEISKNVTYGNSVFANSGVDSVTIENGIKKLPSNAFVNCEDIANVSIPVSVTDTNNAFSGTHIEKITYEGTRAQFERIMEGLSFDEVECLADGATYTMDDFIDHTIPVESITFESAHIGLEIRDTATLMATVLPENTTDQTLAWASSNDLAVTVDQNGTVTAVAVGVSEISATSADGKVKAICTVYVSKAANLTEATLYASNVTAKNSETFEMAVSLQNNPGIASMRVKVDYNDAVMQLIDVEDMGLLGDAFHSTDYDATPYTLYWDNGTAAENFTANGDIAKFTFKVYDNVTAGEYPITLTCDYDNADAINCDLEAVQIETVEGNVSIESFLYGDVDDNEKVNAIDSAILSRFIAKWPGVMVNLDAADVNKDTKVNALDSAILKRHVANWAEYRSLPYVMNGISLFAADSNVPDEMGTLSVSSAAGRVGDTVDVYVSLDDNPGIVTMRLDVDYDQEALELIGVEDLGILPGEVHSLEHGLYPYVLYWDNGAAQSDFTQTGKLVRLTFLVKENAETGDYAVSVSYDADNYDIFNKDLSKVPFETVAGSVRVLDAAPNIPTITVSKVQVGQKTTCTVDLTSPESITGKVIVSVYDNNNKLLECKRFDAVEHIDVEMNTTNGAKMKVMWWEDMDSMIPVTEAVETGLN